MLLDRVVETTTVTGTGTMSLAGAAVIDGVTMRKFVTVGGSGATVAYLIVDTAGNWEYGTGVVTSGSPDTLTRATVLRSSNSNAAVNFSAGTKYVYATANSDLIRFGAGGLPTLGGTANARTMTAAPPLVALVAGMHFAAINGAAANSGAATLQIDSITAKNIVTPANAALSGGEMPASALLIFYYDGTAFRLLNAIVAASEATTNTGTDASQYVTPQGLARWTGAVAPPQGRLTLTSATPVLTGDVAGAATVYYALYGGQLVPIYDGTRWSMMVFTELSNVLANSSTGKAGPAAAGNNSNYDLFVWNDAGTLRLTRGPAWSSDTARGTGAGTTELQRVNGLYTNKVAITNGPGAGLGTYVGTVRTNGSATVDMKFGSATTNGGEARLCVWNSYNRVTVAARVADTTATWTYGTATWRAANASNTNRISAVFGLNEDAVAARYESLSTGVGTQSVGIGLDSTSALSSLAAGPGATGVTVGLTAPLDGLLGLGFHYMQAIEIGDGANTGTYFGLSTWQRSQISAQLRM